VTLDNEDDLKAAVDELGEFTTVSTQQDVGIVTLVGTEITRSPAILRDIFSVLEKQDIVVTMASLGASDVNISLVLSADTVVAAVTALHDEFITAKKGAIV
jgi:aspartate kinase